MNGNTFFEKYTVDSSNLTRGIYIHVKSHETLHLDFLKFVIYFSDRCKKKKKKKETRAPQSGSPHCKITYRGRMQYI